MCDAYRHALQLCGKQIAGRQAGQGNSRERSTTVPIVFADRLANARESNLQVGPIMIMTVYTYIGGTDDLC